MCQWVVLQGCWAPFITLTHLQLWSPAHSPVVSPCTAPGCCSSTDTAPAAAESELLVQLQWLILAWLPRISRVWPQGIGFQKIHDNSLQCPALKGTTEVKIHLHPQEHQLFRLFWKNSQLAGGLYDFRCSQVALMINSPSHKVSASPTPLLSATYKWWSHLATLTSFPCPSSGDCDKFIFPSSGDGISVTSGEVLRWGTWQCITSHCILCCLYKTFWSSHIEAARSTWKFGALHLDFVCFLGERWCLP